MDKKKIILLVTDCDTTRIVYHALKQDFDIDRVIIEKNISRSLLIKRRIRKKGWFNVAGQLAFMVFVSPLLKRASRKRYRQILDEYALDISPIPAGKITHIDSVNDQACGELIRQLAPALVLVNGTRIIGKNTLKSAEAPFINIHTGITPEFRGVHGGYWAIATGKPSLFGTTIHQVDTGIDTGNVLEQVCIKPSPKDNFATYPVLQYAICLPLLKKVIAAFLEEGIMKTKEPLTRVSKLWYHPTIWQWLRYPARVRR